VLEELINREKLLAKLMVSHQEMASITGSGSWRRRNRLDQHMKWGSAWMG
jgi:hypothetical protein